jgi:hypothetical protein
MNRRDVIKAMAALPIASASQGLASICGTSPCTSQPGSLKIILEGPFAVVLDTANAYHVTAFTPRHNSEHCFLFNGAYQDLQYKYRFQLLPSGLKSMSGKSPCIDQNLSHLCAEHSHFNSSAKHHLMTLDLPCPQRIFASSLSRSVTLTFADATTMQMPMDYVLEYDIDNQNLIKMLGWQGDDQSTLQDNNLTFKFEVGLPKLLGGGDPDLDGSHACDFHNHSLLPYFSDLQNDQAKILTQVQGFNKTTTLECKSGGIITGSP